MSKWNILDKFIAMLRYKKVYKYISDDKIICDIGCGQDASFLKSVMDRSEKCIGLDQYVKDYEYKNLVLKNADIVKNINSLNYKVDIVTMLAVIEHISDAQRLLDNVYKILKKEGLLIITTPTKIAKPVLEFLAFKIKVINADEIKDHKKYYNKEELKYIMKKSEFDVIKYKTFQFGFNQIIICKK